jgi:hypothetical protein
VRSRSAREQQDPVEPATPSAGGEANRSGSLLHSGIHSLGDRQRGRFELAAMRQNRSFFGRREPSRPTLVILSRLHICATRQVDAGRGALINDRAFVSPLERVTDAQWAPLERMVLLTRIQSSGLRVRP